MDFDTFDRDVFLRDFWQQRPLLIRNPWNDWTNPLDPDELAGLACEDDIESRLITQARGTWKLEHGPFAEERFGRLGKKRWTLLVQAVDHAVPAVAALIAPFRFIPNWRIDDIMVSYAVDGGGVGPHFDQYDVFLIQGLGQRRWRVGGRCDSTTELLPHDDLRLLAGFEATDEWLLEPGDILYLPPGFAHDGVAAGPDCMTYSLGFRAPSRSDLIEHWSDDLLATLSDDDRYTDPGLASAANPGEISAAAIDRLHAMVTDKLRDRDAFARWFGRSSSTRKYPEIDWQPAAPVPADRLRAAIAGHIALRRNPASRFSFIRHPPAVLLFVDGECIACGEELAALAEHLAASDVIEVDPALLGLAAAMALIARLIDQGSLTIDDGD